MQYGCHAKPLLAHLCSLELTQTLMTLFDAKQGPLKILVSKKTALLNYMHTKLCTFLLKFLLFHLVCFTSYYKLV